MGDKWRTRKGSSEFANTQSVPLMGPSFNSTILPYLKVSDGLGDRARTGAGSELRINHEDLCSFDDIYFLDHESEY